MSPKPLKTLTRILKYARWNCRRLTARHRTLPNFIIIGAQKAGTSSLRYYLKQLPNVKTGFRKEVHFFDRNYTRGESWYRAHFPLATGKSSRMAIGEASPYYLIYPHAPERMHALVPSARLIVLLRNPRERAISHYYHSVKKNRESLPLYEALLAEEERIGDAWNKILEDEHFLSFDHRYFSYKQRGVYADQLERYFAFFDKKNVLVIDSERLLSDPENVLRDICVFLQIDPVFKNINFSPRNVGISKDKTPEEVTQYLNDYFRPHNKRLYELIGRNFSWDEPVS